MIALLSIFYFIAVISAFKSNQKRVCYNSFDTPYTGYRLEYQLELKTWKYEYHLVCCHDNTLIYDLSLNDTIPWTKELYFTKTNLTNHLNQLILSRSKPYALRSLPLYVPNSLVGALFHNGTSKSSIPLFADNLLSNWLELTYKLDFILHVPILSTPNIDDKNYQTLDHWDSQISISESYVYKSSTFKRVQSSLASFFANINQKYDGKFKAQQLFQKITSSPKTNLMKVILLSKFVTKSDFQNILTKFDQMTKIDI